MSEHRTITFPKTTPLIERISGVSKEISEWLKSLEEPFNVNRDTMQLVKYERNDKYSYHYIIDRAVKDPDKRSAVRESQEAGEKAK
jgi:hypothetical protein